MSKTKQKPPSPPSDERPPTTTLNLTATAQIEAAVAGNETDSPALPRFQMLAYTGGPISHLPILGRWPSGTIGGQPAVPTSESFAPAPTA